VRWIFTREYFNNKYWITWDTKPREMRDILAVVAKDLYISNKQVEKSVAI
jgi:uncharacterized protein YqjF (DUF2071 family)